MIILKRKNKFQFIGEYVCEITKAMDEIKNTEKEVSSDYYVLVLREPLLDENKLIIRIPGHTVGTIVMNSSWVITDIVINDDDINKGVFLKDINQKLSKFIGEKIDFEFSYSILPTTPQPLNNIIKYCRQLLQDGNDVCLGKQCTHEYIIYRFSPWTTEERKIISLYKYHLSEDKTLVTKVSKCMEYTNWLLDEIDDCMYSYIVKVGYLPIMVGK